MTQDGADAFDPTTDPDATGEVTESLTRVLASRAFAGAERSRAFLSYVVTETLAGRGRQLSERAVGRHGLHGGAEFDGRLDSLVRVRATRVRKALGAYYAGEGATDPIRIDLPAGSYVPTFTRVPVALPAGRRLDPAVLVMLFDAIGDDAVATASALSEALVGRLASFPGLRVVGPATARSTNPLQVGRRFDVRYVVQGSVLRLGSSLRLSARVTDAESGETIWATADTLARDSAQLWDLAEQWVGVVAGELGDYPGLLLTRPNRQQSQVGSRESAARLAFYRYLSEGTTASLLEARRQLTEVVAEDPGAARSAATLAMYGSALAVPALYGMSDDPQADFAAAESAAREVLTLDPRSGHAHMVLGTIAVGRGQWSVAIERARDGARLAPAHPTLLATAATLLSASGAWDEGVSLLREALRLNPAHPGYLHGLLAVDTVLAGDDSAALAEASLIHAPDTWWGPFYRSLALAGMGYLNQARGEYAAAVAIDPVVAEGPRAILASMLNLRADQWAALEDRVALIRGSTPEEPLGPDR